MCALNTDMNFIIRIELIIFSILLLVSKKEFMKFKIIYA